MRYPSLSESACRRLAGLKLMGSLESIDSDVAWIGVGGDLDLEPIEKSAQVCIETISSMSRTSDRDRVEGALSGVLWDSVQHVPISILDDPGFWRYLTMALFWEFIEWREHRAFKSGNYAKYVDCVSSTESVLPRMYLRSSAVGGSAYADSTTALTNATDFWRSHVLRVRTGTLPIVTRELVAEQARERMSTDRLREFAKRLNRAWANSVPQLLDGDEARELIADVRKSLLNEDERD